MLDAVSTVGRENEKIRPMLAEIVGDALRRFLPLEANVTDFNPEFGPELPWWIPLLREAPLYRQPSNVRERQCSAVAGLLDMKEPQFAPGRQGNAQRVRESSAAQI
jgi:hypothetical protein